MEWKKRIPLIIGLFGFVGIFYIFGDMYEKANFADDELKKCRTDFLENIPNRSNDGSTVIYNLNCDIGCTEVIITAFIGNLTNIHTKRNPGFLRKGEEEDTIEFADGTRIQAYYAEGYIWQKGKIYQVIVARYKESDIGAVQNITVIN